MKKTFIEDWEFEITVVKGVAEQCRMGFEAGDKFKCTYECPTGFCSKTMSTLYTLCEIVRCGGDYSSKSDSSYEIDFPCVDSSIVFRLIAKQHDGTYT